ncbi:hypothetical protein [Treponema sp. J25]|uniref:hypothetical protein n=1 Tax=Treponema sp. J25 TaxID=2094121 RepID=UPI00104A2A2C|nr:hypothetical protein [Treponema sp. J25]TCW61196.1 hypothetical protein C5O22_07385 [Treponema sp. J25]
MKRGTVILLALVGAFLLLACPIERSQKYPDYTLPIKVDVTTTTNTAAIQVSATSTSNAYCTYTITITGLVADIGKKLVVAGSQIGSTPTNIGDNWNVTADTVTDTGLVGTVDSTGTFAITFYGKAPSWGNANDGAQFKICYYDDASWKLVLGNSTGDNFCVSGATPTTTSGGTTTTTYQDITLTIDPNKL